MTENKEHFENDFDRKALPKLTEDLNTLFKPQFPVPPEVDRAIMDRANQHFAGQKFGKNRQQRFRWASLWKIAAAAAIIIFAFSLDLTKKSAPTTQQLISAPALSIKIEMLSDNGSIIIPAGRQITTTDALTTLIINNKHQIVLNSDTTVSLEPLLENNRIGSLVKLASGQVYVKVEHDNNPFVVATAHGRAIINGTIFDVKATEVATTLIVAEGTVQLASQAGFVQVTAGQSSKITADSAPTRPELCNAAQLTAWATAERAERTEPALVKAQSILKCEDYDLSDLGIIAVSGPIDLERIRYDSWVEKNREWFEREFPHITQLRNALAKEEIETDYPELLIASGDIWQFVYPPTTTYRVPIITREPLLKTASTYGFDEQWLKENVRASKSAIDSAAIKEKRIGQKAFEQWAGYFGRLRKSLKEVDGDILLDSLHAGVYLENTRTLLWLCINTGKADSPAKDKAEVLELLQTEVNAANKLTSYILRLLVASTNQPCCDEYQELLENVIEKINEIKEIEERILDSTKGSMT